MTRPAAPVAIIWDGSRHVAAIWSAAAPARFLAAEEAGGRISLIAAGNDANTTLTGVLPPGGSVLHAVTISSEGDFASIPVQLDERLAAGQVAAGTAGLDLLRIGAGEDGTLSIARSAADAAPGRDDPALAASGLNQLGGSVAEGMRLIAGPFLHPQDERAALTRITATRADEGLVLAFRGADGVADAAAATGILVAHLPAAMRRARQALVPLDADLRLAIEAELDALADVPSAWREPDASGLGRIAAMRRGFSLQHPRPEPQGECRLVLPDWAEEDDVIVFAEPRRQLLWAGAGEAASGAPMTIGFRDGKLGAVSHRESYAASVATGLTIGGAGQTALVLADPGTAPPLHDDLALSASRLAEKLWQNAGAARPSRLTALLLERAKARASAPQASFLTALDARMKTPEASGTLLDALAATVGIDPSRTDELGERTLQEQVAMLLWAAMRPKLTARACAVRFLLPLPKPGEATDGIEKLLGWYEDPALPHLLNREATALAGHDRRAMRLLQDVAACAHQNWLDQGLVAEVEQAVAEARRRRGQKPISGLDSLIATLRSRPQRQQGPVPALEEVARLRTELGEAAARSGQLPALGEELSRRLAELTPAEIMMLHGHFAGLRREADQSEAAAALIAVWERAAGHDGLAARAHRGGDPLLGAAKLAATTSGFSPALARIDSLAPALAAMAADIEGALGREAGSLHGEALRRTLEGYGRLLLLQRVLIEADAALSSAPFAAQALADPDDPGFGAAYRRLRAGASDTLARYLAAAAAISGVDHEWGVGLGQGAPARPGTPAARDNA